MVCGLPNMFGSQCALVNKIYIFLFLFQLPVCNVSYRPTRSYIKRANWGVLHKRPMQLPFMGAVLSPVVNITSVTREAYQITPQ